jgi:hypothetical protein
MRLPTYKELRRFVEVEGWVNKTKASGKPTGDHFRYTFVTPENEALYFRVSHGTGQIRNPDLFREILNKQLKVTSEQFWDAVDQGIKPTRPTTVPQAAPGAALDAKLARNLITKVGLSPAQLVGMPPTEGVRIWQEWLASGGATPPTGLP